MLDMIIFGGAGACLRQARLLLIHAQTLSLTIGHSPWQFKRRMGRSFITSGFVSRDPAEACCVWLPTAQRLNGSVLKHTRLRSGWTDLSVLPRDPNALTFIKARRHGSRRVTARLTKVPIYTQ